MDQVALRDGCEIGIAWDEAMNTLVGVLDGSLLPGSTGIAEPASCANPIFQSPESGKLGGAKVKLWRAKAGRAENVAMILSMIGPECRFGS